jgi:hypothetical protein
MLNICWPMSITVQHDSSLPMEGFLNFQMTQPGRSTVTTPYQWRPYDFYF